MFSAPPQHPAPAYLAVADVRALSSYGNRRKNFPGLPLPLGTAHQATPERNHIVVAVSSEHNYNTLYRLNMLGIYLVYMKQVLMIIQQLII